MGWLVVTSVWLFGIFGAALKFEISNPESQIRRHTVCARGSSAPCIALFSSPVTRH
jgi:hypothetical protein